MERVLAELKAALKSDHTSSLGILRPAGSQTDAAIGLGGGQRSSKLSDDGSCVCWSGVVRFVLVGRQRLQRQT